MKLTEKQKQEICLLIGEWYAEWKYKLIDWDNNTHSFGVAKEQLKEKICALKFSGTTHRMAKRRNGIDFVEEIFKEERKVNSKHYQKLQLDRDEYYWYNYLKAKAFDKILGLAKAQKMIKQQKKVGD